MLALHPVTHPGFVAPASIPEVSQRARLSNDSIKHILASIHSAIEDTGRSERRMR
jgi:hypothetical protein